MVPDRDKPRGRELYLSGGWGSFSELLRRAIATSLAVIDAAATALAADARDEQRAIDALYRTFPRGTIDARGDDVDVKVPYRVPAIVPALAIV